MRTSDVSECATLFCEHAQWMGDYYLSPSVVSYDAIVAAAQCDTNVRRRAAATDLLRVT